MNIGELFINLGIKGNEKTIGALTGVKKEMGNVKTVSFEAKAAILSAVYALGRLVNSTGKQGNELAHFNALMDTSTKTLQQYQYAAQQVGVSNEEVTGSFKGLQASMTKILTGEAVPKGLARLAMVTGEISPEDILKFQKSPELLLQRLQQYANKEQNKGLRNEVMKSFGLGDGMVAALSKNAFRPEVLNKAPSYNDNEINALQKNQALWANLGQKMEMAFGRLNVQHGGKLISDLTKLADAFLGLTNAMIKFSDQIGLFQKIGDVMSGWGTLLSGGVTKEVEKLTAEKYGEENKGSFFNQLKAIGSLLLDGSETTEETAPKKPLGAINSLQQGAGARFLGGPQKIAPEAIAPNQPAINNQNSNKVQNTTVNQTFNGNNGSNAGEVKDATKKGIQEAFRQIPAQAQGS